MPARPVSRWPRGGGTIFVRDRHGSGNRRSHRSNGSSRCMSQSKTRKPFFATGPSRLSLSARSVRVSSHSRNWRRPSGGPAATPLGGWRVIQQVAGEAREGGCRVTQLLGGEARERGWRVTQQLGGEAREGGWGRSPQLKKGW